MSGWLSGEDLLLAEPGPRLRDSLRYLGEEDPIY